MMAKNLRHGWVLLLMACSLLYTVSLQAQQPAATEIVIAAAADLSAALAELSGIYEKETGLKTKLSFAASGALTQQIENGAPFDVFLSADMQYPQRLVAAHLGDPCIYEYAVGKLVLWIPADSSLDIANRGMDALLDPSVKKIAIANPQHAPYGRAAVAALEHFKLYDQVKDRLVLGENVAQAAQFVESGNVQAGLVALAHALAPGMETKGKYWIVPPDSYPALAQGAVVLSRSHHKHEVQEFLKYLQSKEAIELLAKYGFTRPLASSGPGH